MNERKVRDMQKLTIDSSVFISTLLETDTFHKASLDFFRLLAAHPASITEPITVLLEVANVLTKAGEKNLSSVLDSFLQFHVLPLDESLIRDTLFVFSKVRLKTADAIVVWCTSASESALITWDKILLREARNLVPAFTPREYIKEFAG